MKQILFYTCFAALGFMVSCSKDFLDQQPLSNVATTTFYKTQNDFNQALTGVYNALLSTGIYVEHYNFGELPSDNVFKPGAGSDPQLMFSNFTLDQTNGYLARCWNDHYAAIQRANILLGRIDAATFDAAAKARIAAEAKFLRALFYFNLVRIFGAVPLVTTEITDVNQAYEYGRAPVAGVYTQIVKDLTESEGALPKQVPADYGRATRGAAKALLGKVYATQGNWAQAAAKLKEVVDAADYTLVTDYASLFRFATENNSEVIFAAQFQAGPFAASFPFWFSPLGASVFGGVGRGDFSPTPDLVQAYETNDLRKAASIDSALVGGSYIRYTKKYAEGYNNSDNNWIILRYADVLLMYAEALNETVYSADISGPAFTALNTIRNRAALPALDAVALPDQASFRAAVARERRVELAFEGHRWFDLVRTNQALPVINAVLAQKNIAQPITQNNLLFPLPLAQILINPARMDQNPGY